MKERLKELLKKSHISIEEMAVEVGVSPDIIRKYLRGSQPISEQFLRKLANAYPNLNMEWLENDVGEMYKWKDKPSGTEENKEPYGQKRCEELLKEKDFIIESYKQIIEEQRNVIRELTELKNVKKG